jgi:hypothetical protein
MKTVSDFLPWVELEAQDTPVANMQHAVREALIYFMRESGAVVDELFVNLPAGQDDIALTIPECRRIVGVNGVWTAPTYGSSRWTPEWDSVRAMDGDGAGYMLDDIGSPMSTLWVLPRSNKPRTLCIKYRWSIGRDACEVPDWIYHDYAKAIASGALAYLHRNVQDPSMSTPFSGVVGTEFDTAVRQLAVRVKSSYSNHNRRIRSGWGGAG